MSRGIGILLQIGTPRCSSWAISQLTIASRQCPLLSWEIHIGRLAHKLCWRGRLVFIIWRIQECRWAAGTRTEMRIGHVSWQCFPSCSEQSWLKLFYTLQTALLWHALVDGWAWLHVPPIDDLKRHLKLLLKSYRCRKVSTKSSRVLEYWGSLSWWEKVVGR